MTGHFLADEGERRTPVRRMGSDALRQLQWPDFWLLCAILGGMLALVAAVFLALQGPTATP
ncbi:MAG TPA: hypothetical protein VEL79_17345 [Vicinamibacterales bacterium]|nr:hypothetical protein [Vicinamibacterales bacterium]